MRRLLALVVLALLAFGAVHAYGWYQNQVNAPVSKSSQPVALNVAAGESSSDIGDDLVAKGLVRDKQVFLFYLRFSGGFNKIQAGDYTLNRNMNMKAIVAALQHGQLAQVKVAIPEGYTEKLIAKVAEGAGLGSAGAYLGAAKAGSWQYDFLSSRPAGTDLEGYLFPDTYYLDRGAGVRDLVKAQLDEFGRSFSPDLRTQAAKPNSMRPAESVQAIVILASMIEREVNRDPDRAIVCGIYYNRLQVHMALQVDATVLYALGVWKKQVTFEDLKYQSPYNTYLNPGLPPGPISNPGAAAIKACVNPQQSNYLYYFTDPKGVTHFEETLAQFNSDKQRFGVAGA